MPTTSETAIPETTGPEGAVGVRSLKRKVLVPLLVVASALATLAVWGIHAKSHYQFVEKLRQRTELVANTVNRAASGTSDVGELQRIVSAIGAEEEVDLILVTGGNPARVLASTRPDWSGKAVSDLQVPELLEDLRKAGSSGAHDRLDRGAGKFDFTAPVSNTGGAVAVHLDTRRTDAEIRGSVIQFSVAFLAILGALTGLGYWLLMRHVLSPIEALGHYIAKRHGGGEAYWAKAATNDELGLLARNLKNALVRTDEALHDLENYKAALDEHAIVSVIDLHGRILHANEHLRAISQYSQGELIGSSPRLLYSGYHPREFFSEMWSTLSSGNVWHGEICDRAKDGSLYWTASTVVPLVASDGIARQFIGIGKDITGRKKIEHDLAYERDLLSTLLENSPDQIYFKDIESRFIRCGRAVTERFDLSEEKEIIGKCDFDFYADEHATAAFEDEQRIISTGEPVLGRIERESWKDGRITWALTTKVALRDESGGIIGTFGISKDITAIKEAEARLIEANVRLVETSRQAGMAEVATSVLHNVGNVLNSVNVSCSVISSAVRKSRVGNVAKTAALLREHEADLAGFFTSHPTGRLLPEFLGQLAERLAAEQDGMLAELRLLGKNIDHIKEIVAMQQNYGRISGIREISNVIELVEDSVRMNAESLVRHETRLIRDFSEVPLIRVEKHKVLQILVNLIRNAKDACDDLGPAEKRITLRVSFEGGRVKISVSDNGVGIPAENLTRIFNHGFTTRASGHGFGLHASALAAGEMGGSLTVYSDGPGAGAVFTLDLPVDPDGDIANPTYPTN